MHFSRFCPYTCQHLFVAWTLLSLAKRGKEGDAQARAPAFDFLSPTSTTAFATCLSPQRLLGHPWGSRRHCSSRQLCGTLHFRPCTCEISSAFFLLCFKGHRLGDFDSAAFYVHSLGRTRLFGCASPFSGGGLCRLARRFSWAEVQAHHRRVAKDCQGSLWLLIPSFLVQFWRHSRRMRSTSWKSTRRAGKAHRPAFYWTLQIGLSSWQCASMIHLLRSLCRSCSPSRSFTMAFVLCIFCIALHSMPANRSRW